MLNQEAKQVIDFALLLAKDRRHEFAGVEHLCCALFENEKIKSLLEIIGISKYELKQRFLEYIDSNYEEVPLPTILETLPSLGFQRVLERATVHVVSAGKKLVKVEDLLVAAFDEEESYAVYLMKSAGITRLDLVSVISHGDYSENFIENDNVSIDEEIENKKENSLGNYAVCLTDKAKRKELDEVIGRNEEIDRAILVLSRKKKNHPLFVGEPGVGKTALAEGLAIRIIKGQVPKILKDAQMFLLDLGAMLAGARYRGDFENRIKSVLKLLETKKHPIIVIDEIHTVVGAGATTGSSMDASNLLKPILAKGNLRFIGSTTYKEYRTYFEKDRALARRFQKIDIKEPSIEECEQILLGIKKRYEDFHQVLIESSSLKWAVSLAQKFIHERFLPDKAIDLLDEACALVRLDEKTKEKIVTRSKIEEALSSIANIPSQRINQDDKNELKKLEEKLKAVIFGQDEAIQRLTNAILLSKAGLREKEKPIGSFLFTGPTGVGKTESAKKLAEILGISLIRFDMSEYMEKHAVSRLVGAPPGYVGYDDGGLLTESVYKNPHAVLLLDEIEKAHPDAFNMLLQIMDYGKLTDSNGRMVDFRHCILIMTSNVGARELEQNSIGFIEGNKNKGESTELKRLFSPEFRNRLDAIITFNHLAKTTILDVVTKFITNLKIQLKEKNITLNLTDEAKIFLAEKGYDKTFGARPLGRIIDEKIKKPLSKEMLFGKLQKGGNVTIAFKDNDIFLSF